MKKIIFLTAQPRMMGEEDYFSDCATTYDGYAMLAVRKKNPEKEEDIHIHFYAQGCEEMEINIGQKEGEKVEKSLRGIGADILLLSY